MLWQHGTLGRSLGCFALHPRCGPWPQRCKVTRAFKFIELVPSYFPCSAQETSRQLSWKGNLYIFCKNSNHIINTGDSSFLNEDCDESQESFLKKVTRACFLILKRLRKKVSLFTNPAGCVSLGTPPAVHMKPSSPGGFHTHFRYQSCLHSFNCIITKSSVWS